MSSSSNSSAQSSFVIYQIYGKAGFSWELASIFSLKFVITTFCLITNADLAYITWKNKTLRSSCNKLVAICAAATALDMVSTAVPFLLTIAGINFIPLLHCALIQSPQGVAHVFANNMAFFIGLDRLLAVTFPFWYKNREAESRNYVLAICALCSTIPLAILGLTYNEALFNPNKPVLCTLADPLGRWGTEVQIMQLSFEGMAAACYALIMVVLKVRRGSGKNVQMSVLKSLGYILLLELVGWVTHYALRLILLPLLDPATYWFIINISTYIPYTCWALTPFILYKCAKEYKAAFLRQFRTNQVSSVSAFHHAGGRFGVGLNVGKRTTTTTRSG